MSGNTFRGTFRPYHLKITLPTFSASMTEFLSFEIKFLRHAQRYEFGIASLEEAEVRLSETTEMPENPYRIDSSQGRVRRAHHV